MNKYIKAGHRQKSPSHHRGEDGMASLIVAGVMIVVLSLISFGFARIMERSQTNSVNNQLEARAYYAARSAVGDALKYITDNPGATSTTCNTLLQGGGALQNVSQLSTDGTTRYTCLLINDKPSELVYQKVAAQKSQVVKLLPDTGQLSSLLISFKSTDPTHNRTVGGSWRFEDQATWFSNNTHPILRVALYPMPASGSFANAQTDSKTFFLYPAAAGGGKTTNYSGTTDGSIRPAPCDKNALPTFNGSQDYDCNTVITGLNSIASGTVPAYYYLRITPIYLSADFKLKANDTSNGIVKFRGAQVVIDATAKSADSYQRLVAHADSSSVGGVPINLGSGDNAIPEYSVRSAGALCKRLNVGLTITTIDASAATACNLGFTPSQLPPVSLLDPVTNLTSASLTFNGNVNPRGGNVTSCYFEFGTSVLFGRTQNCASLPGSGSSPVAVTANVTGLTASTTYYYRLCAKNSNPLPGCSSTVTVTTPAPAPPPTVSLTATSIIIIAGGSTTLNWTSTNATSCSAPWTPQTGTSGGQSVSPASTTTYSITCTGPGGVVSGTITITVNPGGGGGTPCTSSASGIVSGGRVLSGGDTEVPLPTSVSYSWNGGCPAATSGQAYWFQAVCYNITCGSPPTVLGNRLGWGVGPPCGAVYNVQCFVGAGGGPQTAPSGSDNFCMDFGAFDGAGGFGGARAGNSGWGTNCFVNGSGSGGGGGGSGTCFVILSGIIVNSYPGACNGSGCFAIGVPGCSETFIPSGGGGGGGGPTCPPGGGGNSCTYSTFFDCDYGDGVPQGYPRTAFGAQMCGDDGGTWHGFCSSSSGATRPYACSGGPNNF